MAYEPRVTRLWATPNPEFVVYIAARMAKEPDATIKHIDCDKAYQLSKTLYKAGHHAALEHVACSFLIRDVSRAFMAQITRHRHLSFTCTSQHFQNYQDYPTVCEDPAISRLSRRIVMEYQELLADGKDKAEARMVLPNSMGVNMVVTGNATAWAHVMRLRLCRVNTQEMQAVAKVLHSGLVAWYPALFTEVHEPCADTYLKECREPHPCHMTRYSEKDGKVNV